MKNQLVRFDWALKKLLRNKANFDILEGFLSELLLVDVKIEQILESESNKQSADDKYNRVDLLTQINSGELVLIELQAEAQYDYFHRMVYGASKLITDTMDSGFSYDKVRKVISINIVYFDLGHGTDYVYKGTTDFRGIHTNDILQLSLMQKKEFSSLQKVSDIFPEYYILKVNGFNDIGKNSLDEWIYFLKNSEIKSEFKAKGLQKASWVFDVLRLSHEVRKSYERYIDDCRVAESSVRTAWLEGYQKGVEEAIEERLESNKEIASKMLRGGETIEYIMKFTGLSPE